MTIADDAQIDRLRRMSAAERVSLANALWLQAWEAVAAGVRARHPDWAEAQVVEQVRALFRAANT